MRTADIQPKKGSLAHEFSMVSVDRPDVIVDTVKKHEDRKEIIFRLYMSQKSRGKCTIRFAGEPVKVHEVSLMEANQNEIPLSGNEIATYFTPYEIKTFSVKYR